MPKPFRIQPIDALRIVRQIQERVKTVALTESEYLAVNESLAPRGLMGGIVFDALLMRCARKVEASRIYSLNTSDFSLVDAELAVLFVEP